MKPRFRNSIAGFLVASALLCLFACGAQDGPRYSYRKTAHMQIDKKIKGEPSSDTVRVFYDGDFVCDTTEFIPDGRYIVFLRKSNNHGWYAPSWYQYSVTEVVDGFMATTWGRVPERMSIDDGIQAIGKVVQESGSQAAPVGFAPHFNWSKIPRMHFLLFYDGAEGYVERRAPFRAAHIAHAREAVARGDLVLGGALANPTDGAVLLFRGESPAAAERFAESDPYVKNGVVARWRVREWTTVVGPAAEAPL